MGLPPAHLVVVSLALSLASNGQAWQESGAENGGHNVCSTWGNFHYKTFDGDVFRFPGLCDYNFASDCRDSYQEFAVHLQRGPGPDGGVSQITSLVLIIKDDVIYLTNQLTVVNGAMVSTPHYSSGLLIEKNEVYTKIYSRAGLSLMWNREDSLMLSLDSKYQNHTCGLCGDYNGEQGSEFVSEDLTLSPVEFGNKQKINNPQVECEDPEDAADPESCSVHRAECKRLLTAAAFEDCQGRVPLEPYLQACVQDLCLCGANASCACSTLSEFSRQCSHAGGRPGTWRTASFCPKTCPGNMVYLESGSPCVDTCSHLEVSNLCEEHPMDGCFCPEGTVYDDIGGEGCIPLSQCHCKLHGHLYAPGQEVTNQCEQCVCHAGRWECQDLPCPGTCTLEGGSHITTFDGKRFTFHGDCYYVLSKGAQNDSHALLGELAPCGSTEKQTCLKTVVLVTDKKKDVVTFKSDGRVLLNELEVHLPHVTGSFSVFQPSSHHIIVHTAFGLRLQIQLVPVMQLFATLDQDSQGQVQGLCGNFNGQESDDFQTASGLVEATGAGFANTWKAQSSCRDKLDWLDDPCSLSIETNYAEHWCSLLKKTETPFGKCHSAVDPTEYYKRCKYDTCNCDKNEDCLCAALSSYAHACAAKGVMLWGWREQVCNKEVGSCPSSQVFLYNLTTCQQTCRSLSEGNSHCLEGFAPVDGCGCPDHTFLDEKGRCVPLAKCSCYHNGLYLEAGDVVLRQEERCVCRNGRLQCTQVKLLAQSCAAPKVLVDCNNLTALTTLRPRPRSCKTLVASYYHTECVSGCVCPDGLIDDGRGGCVVEDDCPCLYHTSLYSSGDKIKVDCNTCTCRGGQWQCTKLQCHGTCSIHGSGHYMTFDGKYYDFDGHCSYVAAQDYCGQNSSAGSFRIITENVPCGTTGVTCSKAIKIFLGGTELKLEEKRRWVVQLDAARRAAFTTREVGQYLVVEASTGVIVIWDKKTTIFIKLAPSYKGTVCGLCGNFDDRSTNDFTTRDHMVVSSELDFGNSWKESSTCPDVSSTPEPCSLNPHRHSWAQKQCSILKSSVFGPCHGKVDPTVFYEACVHDSCSCDTGGDCECFCSAVAAYAQECTKAGACVYWRTPDLCPIFCDYYNPPNECEWHYEPCGNRSFETCRTINGIHSNISVSYLEGCYPRCPRHKPIYDEDLKKCVTANRCGCYIEDNHYTPGEHVPTEDICKSCTCTEHSKVHCQWEEGKVVNQTQDRGFCFWDICGPNGTVYQHFNVCVSTPSPITHTSTPATPSTLLTSTSTSTTSSTSSSGTCCWWSDWINEDHPTSGTDGGDHEAFDSVCEKPVDIECRSATEPHLSWEKLDQKAECSVSQGFSCVNANQYGKGVFELCYDYEIRVKCCVPHGTCTPSTLTPTPSTSPTTPSTSTPTPSTSPTTPSTSTPTPSTSPTTPSTSTPTPSTSPTTPSTSTPTPSTPPTTPSTSTPTPSTSPTTPSTSTPTPSTPPTTPSTSTPTPSTSPTTPSTSTPTPSTTCAPQCQWTGWHDSGKPEFTQEGGDNETVESVCAPPSFAKNISCRSAMFPSLPLDQLGQTVVCNLHDGLVCRNKDQVPGGRPFPQPYCMNYEINVLCCNQTQCTTTTTKTTTRTSTTTPTTTTETPATTTTTTTETPTPTPTTTTTPTTTPTETPITTPSTTSTTTSTATTTPKTHTTTPTTSTTETPTPTPTTTTEISTTTPTTSTPTTIPTETSSTAHTTTPTTTSSPTTTPKTHTSTPTTTTTSTETPTATPTTITEISNTTPTTSTLTTYPTETPTTTPPSTTTPTTTSTTTTTEISTTTPTLSTPTTTHTVSSTQIYCCIVNDTASNNVTYYSPGEEVYSGKKGDHCYYANCSVDCTIQYFNWSCPSSPSPTTSPTPTPTSTSTPTSTTPTPTSTPSSPTTTSTTSTSKPTTTKKPGCPDFNPPREENESWWLCNCTKAVCRDDNTVEIVEVKCEPPPPPTCSNGLKPVRVLDEDGCCWHWECDCFCTGWGDPHYVTFDGLYYSYQGNCTYVLVEEIVPTVDNFGVYIDNYHCDERDKVSCPRTLVVRHETQEVQIRTVNMMPIEVQVQVNRQMVALPYKKFGLQVYESGINIVVEVPELGVVVTYNGLTFSVQLPYRLFGNNTKGQCGTCTNNTADDCMLPSGEVISNCEVAADEWVVADPSKPQCTPGAFTTQSPAVTTQASRAPPKNCTGSPVCQLIQDSLFAGCHALVPPKHYYEACVYDTCFVPDARLECASLQIYAALCAQEGFCVDWRHHTGDACPVTCPSHREYQACGPPEEPTCQSGTPQNSTRLVEGCFCPEGTMNFAPGYDVCVKTCGCVGPDSVPREFGERFEFACNDCVCLEGGSGIVCQAKECSQEGPTACTEEGTYLVTEVNPADTCCTLTSCKCNASLCGQELPTCSLGFEPKSRIVSGRCCPVYECVPKGVCVHEKAEYQPGSPVYSSKCQNCVCTGSQDSSGLNVISCSPVPCNVSCSPGFEPVDVPGECCQKCEQTHCIIQVPDSPYLVLKPGEVHQDPENRCTFFSCVKIHDQLISSLSNITCPEFDPSSCAPGSISLMADGCCQQCTPLNQTEAPCSTVPVVLELSSSGCSKNVTVNDCSGSCGTFARYSSSAKLTESRCSCCREYKTSQRQVQLDCPNGKQMAYTYTHVDSCLCQESTCERRSRRSVPRLLSGQ
ncbi:mucin-2 [Ochotona curzoniae]|uniref:mucin-2 n=1 Tax=Ochotona curzoniae TaxID=130825 RepID=UPI001B34D8A9|nr:mucin-2 [Ochotona curzoniae]